MIKKILVLSYKKKYSKIIFYLTQLKNFRVFQTSKKIQSRDVKKFDLIICFGYRHLIEQEILSQSKRIINLHPSYLPYNRGAYPNFWSFADNTPSGVTIHSIDQGIDTGKIIYQKLIDFDLVRNKKKLTFKNTHDRLISEMELIFLNNIKNIVNNNYQSFEQIGEGSFHRTSQLPEIVKSWNQNIFKTIQTYNRQKNAMIKKRLDILDQIQSTRKNNNVNWMNVLRTSIKDSTFETLKIVKKINNQDSRISNLFKKLNNE